MSDPVVEKKKLRGTVQRVLTPNMDDPDNYYGFIIDTEGQKYFLHCREVCGDFYPEAGNTVYFYPSLEDGKRYLRAMEIEIISPGLRQYVEERVRALVANNA